jgi:hypothetical protein
MLKRLLLATLPLMIALPSAAASAPVDPAGAARAAGEPPLADILKRQGYTIGVNKDEVDAQRFVKAGPGPVTHEPIAAFGLEKRCRSGWYRPVDGAPTLQPLWSVDANHNKQDHPPLMRGAVTRFDPGDAPFGLWVSTSGFENETVYTEDALQRFLPRFKPDDRHKAHVYPVKKGGRLIPNS